MLKIKTILLALLVTLTAIFAGCDDEEEETQAGAEVECEVHRGTGEEVCEEVPAEEETDMEVPEEEAEEEESVEEEVEAEVEESTEEEAEEEEEAVAGEQSEEDPASEDGE